MGKLDSSHPGDAPMSLRDAQKQFTRTRLIDAATRLFYERGYTATTIEDIVGAAGATRATFYLHFRSKSEVVSEAMQAIRDDSNELWEALAEAVQSGERAALQAWLERTFQFWERIRLAFAVEEQAAAVESGFVRLSDVALEDGISILMPAIEEGYRHHGESARVRAALMLLQLRDVFHRWRRVGWGEISRDETLEVMADMWSAALRAPAGARK